MNATKRNARGRIILTVIVLTAFAAAFHVAHQQRLAMKPLQDSGGQFLRIALLPRAYAQANDGLWPVLDKDTRAFALPLEDIPRGYTIAPRFSVNMTDPIPAMLLGNINNAAAYTLAPVDPVASSYIYFGYAVTNESEFLALVKSVRGGAQLDEDISVEAGHGTLGSSTLYRLRNTLDDVLVSDGVAHGASADLLSRIPVLMERPRDGFAWVMYLSTKIERLPYPGPFPACAAVVQELKNRVGRFAISP